MVADVILSSLSSSFLRRRLRRYRYRLLSGRRRLIIVEESLQGVQGVLDDVVANDFSVFGEEEAQGVFDRVYGWRFRRCIFGLVFFFFVFVFVGGFFLKIPMTLTVFAVFAATKDVFDQRLDAFGGFAGEVAEVFKRVFSSQLFRFRDASGPIEIVEV